MKDDNKRKCYDCKHYVKTIKNKMFNYTVYGCELWDCKFSQKDINKSKKEEENDNR